MTEHEPIARSFTVRLARAGADQRTLGGCCVPYGRTSTVSDDGVTSYREMFAPGCFGKQLAGSAISRIPLKYRHGAGILDTIGRATQLEEHDDGLWGMFRVLDGLVGDQALALVDEELVTGLSVSGVPMRTTRSAQGVVVRERVHLTEVSLCEEPAYEDALVSVRRSRVDLERPAQPTDEQLARLAAIGIRVGQS